MNMFISVKSWYLNKGYHALPTGLNAAKNLHLTNAGSKHHITAAAQVKREGGTSSGVGQVRGWDKSGGGTSPGVGQVRGWDKSEGRTSSGVGQVRGWDKFGGGTSWGCIIFSSIKSITQTLSHWMKPPQTVNRTPSDSEHITLPRWKGEGGSSLGSVVCTGTFYRFWDGFLIFRFFKKIKIA